MGEQRAAARSRFTLWRKPTQAVVPADIPRPAGSAQTPQAVSVSDARPRTLVTVTGEIRSVSLRPRADVPALDVELWDGSASLHLVWLGRRQIAGIRPGLRLRATGRITEQRRVRTIFNPAYEVLPQGESHD